MPSRMTTPRLEATRPRGSAGCYFCCSRIAPVGLLDEMGDDLGVGLAPELVAPRELLPELGEVLDDAVMDQRDASVAGEVRVGVHLGDAAVGGPAGVPDPERPGKLPPL